MGSSDAYIEGIKYISKGYDINYYNQTIVPTFTSATINSTHHAPVQNLLSETDGDGGYTDKHFVTRSYTETIMDYLYFGSDPLQQRITIKTTLSGKNYIDQENFLVLAVLNKQSQLQRVIIATRMASADSLRNVSYTERTHFNYDKLEHENATFYRQSSIITSRLEDCITATVGEGSEYMSLKEGGNLSFPMINAKNVIYPCQSGASTLQSLTTMIAMLKQGSQDLIFDNAPVIEDESTLSKYYTNLTGEMKPILELAHQDLSLHRLNDILNVGLSKERLSRSVTNMVPLGRNNSHRSLYSERVGEITQDFDSKEFIGGALPYKTQVAPTYPERATAGSGEIAKSVGYGNAVYYSKEDIQTIADNFAAMDDELSYLNISFRGQADLDDLENVIDGDFILDKVSWDIGSNSTTFSCRTVLFN